MNWYQQASKDINEASFNVLQEQSARLKAIWETKARVKAAFDTPWGNYRESDSETFSSSTGGQLGQQFR
jgi:hypothetical protein